MNIVTELERLKTLIAGVYQEEEPFEAIDICNDILDTLDASQIKMITTCEPVARLVSNKKLITNEKFLTKFVDQNTENCTFLSALKENNNVLMHPVGSGTELYTLEKYWVLWVNPFELVKILESFPEVVVKSSNHEIKITVS